MADNVELDAGSGGANIRTKDRGTAETPISLIDVGGTSAEALIGDSGVAMPVRGLAAEDAAASGNPVPAGGRYDLSARTLDDGDRGELALNASAQALVEVATSALPSGAATSAKQDTAAAILTTIDADTGALAGCVGGTELQVDIVNSPTVTIQDGGNTITVDGTVELGATALAALETITVASVTAPLAAGNNNIGDVDVASIAAGDNNIGNVDIVTMPAVTNAGTFAVQVDGAALTALQIMDDWDNGASDGASVSGDVAHDGVDAGEPVKIGAKAIAYGSNPTAVAAADRTDLYANRHGVLMVLGGVPGIITKEWTFADADGAQTDAALVTVGAGTKIAVTNIAAICDNANTGDVAVRVGFAAATLSAAATSGIAGIVMSHPGIAAGSGYNRGDGSGVLGVGADGEDLRITCEDPAGGSIRIIASYFEIAS